MNNLRIHILLCLALSTMVMFSGCVTTGSQSSAPTTDIYGFEQKPKSPTAGMDWMEKTGYYLGWFALESLYVTASSNPSFSP